ncbi:urease accessory protein UreD [Ramlibacter tataouinensis]|uniref:urease accessory protein UreD n=1 Tax=Ramlibacter tataouinensis TaxID=94132 RepID=UPI0022F3D35A|nr:urease accessory protein UreD [Ramlibacter tataouinensis]WBY00575.1 urease accessory protein UreD [Ramlibacter tataouinensis]
MSDLLQEGCLKVRLPRPESDRVLEAVIINTSGGLTGGDVLSVEIEIGEGARACATTPGCERIYRSAGGEAVIEQHLRVGRSARLDWVPQETILFDGSRLKRRTEVQLDRGAELTLAEAILFGRAAMGETVKSGFFSDAWAIRRAGRLVFTDVIRICDAFQATMASPTALRSHVAMASLAHVGPDLEAKRDALRSSFTKLDCATAGASLVNGVLVARMVACTGMALRSALNQALVPLRGARPLPRSWLC